MTLIESLIAQGVRAFREPRAAAADILALGIPREALVPGLMLISIVGVLLDMGLTAAIPEVGLQQSPFRTVVFYMVTAVAFSFGLVQVGKWMGGQGGFQDALILVVFMQAMLLPASAVQIVLAMASPQLAMIFMFGVAVFLIWVQVSFVAALHGFRSLGRAFVVTLIASFVAFLIAAPFLTISSVEVPDV